VLRTVLVMSVVSLSLWGCSSGRSAKWNALPTYQGEAATPAGESSESLVTQGDEAWKNRGDLKGLEAAIVAWEKAVALSPEDAKTLAKLSRAYYFLSDAYLRNGDKKDYLATFERGIAAAERSMAAGNPQFKAAVTSGKKVEEAVQASGPESLEAMYWYASNLGKWARAKGFSTTLGNKDKIRGVMSRVLAVDPNFFHGAADRYFGAFFAVAPGFAGGDMDKSRQHFEKSLQLAPGYVGTKVLMADTWATKKDDRALFEKLLNEVMAAPDDVIPGLEAETRNEKAKAKELLGKANELF
jgi:tetratricopeptide (TPR) repeat protein